MIKDVNAKYLWMTTIENLSKTWSSSNKIVKNDITWWEESKKVINTSAVSIQVNIEYQQLFSLKDNHREPMYPIVAFHYMWLIKNK